ncbi:FecR domain-containing protein [Massilia sp. B-10]|nr:FecR domain-containing protein [Massilia sp. B-10]
MPRHRRSHWPTTIRRAGVGRISLAQGQVDISGEQGDEAEPALVNWPVTSNSQLTTGRDSRTEVRIGSTALRLDADTSIDVNALEDDSLRITLHYGSLSIRVRNPDVLRGFELDTPQGTIRLQDTGRVRVDAGRRADTTALSVFEGEATFDGAGSRLIVRAAKQARRSHPRRRAHRPGPARQLRRMGHDARRARRTLRIGALRHQRNDRL